MCAGLFVATSAAACAPDAPARKVARCSPSPGPSIPFARELRAAGAGGPAVSGAAPQAPRQRQIRAAAVLIADRVHRIEPRRLEPVLHAEEDAHRAGDDER